MGRAMEHDIVSSLAKRLTLAAMSLGYGVVQLDVTIVNTALNTIGTSLGGGVSELQWIVSTYTIAFAALILTAGALIAAVGCVALLGIKPGTSYLAVCGQLVAMGGGLGLLVPPLTSTLLGSVEKARSGIAAGVLNSTRQTGSVLGVALFGSLVGQPSSFIVGAHQALTISAALLLVTSAVTLMGAFPSNTVKRQQQFATCRTGLRGKTNRLR